MIWSEVGLCSAATLVWLARPSHLTARGTKGKGLLGTHKLQTIRRVFPRLASLLSLVRGSSADNAEVTSNEHNVML